jgi:hypothetical protein
MARFVCSGTIDAVQRIAGVDDPRVEATEGVEGAVARASAACVLGFAGLSLAVAFMIGLHWFAPFDPLTSVMSDYALADGVGWLFGASVMGIAVAAICLTIGLSAAGVLSGFVARLTTWVMAVSAVVTAAFPTDKELPLSLTAELHRYGAITLFICVPIAGILVARRLTGVAELAGFRLALLGASATTVVLLTLFLVSHLEAAPAALQHVQGLAQRLMMLAELTVLAQLLSLPLRHGGGLPQPRAEEARAGAG